MQDTRAIIIALVAFAGALVSALIAWSESNEPFNGRKFLSGALRGLVAAIGFALAYKFTDFDFNVFDLLAAFVAGIGFDSGISGLTAKVFKSGSYPIVMATKEEPLPPSTVTIPEPDDEESSDKPRRIS